MGCGRHAHLSVATGADCLPHCLCVPLQRTPAAGDRLSAAAGGGGGLARFKRDDTVGDEGLVQQPV